MEARFVVIDQEFKNGDIISDECYVFDSKTEAENNEFYRWNHLTDSEKKSRMIIVAVVTEDDLDDAAFDGDSTDFRLFNSYNPTMTYSK